MGSGRIADAIGWSRARGLHIGATVQVRLGSEVVVDLAEGDARSEPPTALRPSTPVPGVPLDWGLGVAIDNYMFGRHCSTDSFGSVGATSSMVFADPAHRLSAAVFFNGNCGLADQVRRAHKIATAIYVDLGLAPVHASGRDHVAPLIGVI